MWTSAPTLICEEVRSYLQRHKVVHLRSLPRTPQHNGAGERGIRELKEQLTLGVGPRPPNISMLENQLTQAADLLNKNRRRQSLAFLTAAEFDEKNEARYNKVRENFYRDCSMRIEHAVLEATTARARKMATREAIYASLEKMGWIKQWRGGLQNPATRPEKIS